MMTLFTVLLAPCEQTEDGMAEEQAIFRNEIISQAKEGAKP
jgi:hypothetical protein